MTENLRLEIEKETQKLMNQETSLQEVQGKLSKLQDQVENLRKGIERTVARIDSLGQKEPRRDGKPETSEALKAKTEKNIQLKAEKLDLIKGLINERKPEIWTSLEQYLPEVYKNL